MELNSTKSLAEALRERLQEAANVDPREGFERLVRLGLIDREGRVTHWSGGEAEPEPEALAAIRRSAQ